MSTGLQELQEEIYDAEKAKRKYIVDCVNILFDDLDAIVDSIDIGANALKGISDSFSRIADSIENGKMRPININIVSESLSTQEQLDNISKLIKGDF